jgi:hypothetical protein
MKKLISIIITISICSAAHSQNCQFPTKPATNERIVTHTKGVLADLIDINMDASFFDYQSKSRIIPASKNVLGNSVVFINQFESMEIMNTEVEWLMDYPTFKNLEHMRSRKFQKALNEFYTATLKVVKKGQQYAVRIKLYYPSENWLVWNTLIELYQLKNGVLEKVFDKKQQYQTIRPDFLCIGASTLFNQN